MAVLQVLELLEAIQHFEKKLNLALMYSGLRLPQFRVMLFLKTAGRITVSDLSRHLNVTRATMSVLVGQLLKADIVESTENTSDKRSFYISMTESGRRRLELAESEVHLVEEKISQDFSDHDIEVMNEVFRKLLSRA